MTHSLTSDTERNAQLAVLLAKTFESVGILGVKNMPENLVPKGMEPRSLEHILFITLTVTIDRVRDSMTLWKVARETWEDPETSWLYSPQQLAEAGRAKVHTYMDKCNLSNMTSPDAEYWHTVGISFFKKYDGNPLNFL